MNIGNRLRNLRESVGLTQEEVGKRIGVTKATVNRYETGEIDIKRTVAIKLAEVLKSTPSYIMGWEESSEKIKVPDIGIELYNQLDEFDKAEIRGEIKQMLKADKYNSIEKELRNA